MDKIVIIGGGAAGIFAAINAARLCDGKYEIIVLEKSNQLLSKVKVSGGGRCNVTHDCEDVTDLIKNYPRGFKELVGPFHFFNPKNTKDWFAERNVKLKTETDGRIFPITDSSQTIIDCFLKEAKKYGVIIKNNFSVKSILKTENEFEIENNLGEKIIAKKILIATGGNSQGTIFEILKSSGHTIQPSIPSLFTFNIQQKEITELMGLSVNEVEISTTVSKHKIKGALLFTHWGISGPAVLKMSAFAAKEFHQHNYRFEIIINFVPKKSAKEIIADEVKFSAKQKTFNHPLFDFPKRFWQMIVLKSGINENQNWADCSKIQKENLLKNISAHRLQVHGKSIFKEEFVTCGGITLSEINFKTMQSKLVENLFFAGEIIDVDGITGGFNFQNAWTTAMIAAEAMVK